MSNFKVGDKVRVIKSPFGSFPTGEYGVITEVFESYAAPYDVQPVGTVGDTGNWPMCEDELELVS